VDRNEKELIKYFLVTFIFYGFGLASEVS